MTHVKQLLDTYLGSFYIVYEVFHQLVTWPTQCAGCLHTCSQRTARHSHGHADTQLLLLHCESKTQNTNSIKYTLSVTISITVTVIHTTSSGYIKNIKTNVTQKLGFQTM